MISVTALSPHHYELKYALLSISSLDVFYHNNRSVIDADAVLLTCQILHKVEPICSFFRFHLLYACKYFVLLSRQDTSLTLFYMSDSFGSKLWIIGGTVLLLESLGLSLVLSINIFPSKRKWHNMERNENFSLSTIWAKTGDKKISASVLLIVVSQLTEKKQGQEVCRWGWRFLLEPGPYRQAILTYRWM